MGGPFHNWVTEREGKGQDKAWLEVDTIVSGSYHGNTFIRRVLKHMSSQDELVGGNQPTHGDLFRGKARDGPLGHLGRPPEPKKSGLRKMSLISALQILMKSCRFFDGEIPKPEEQVEQEQDMDRINE